MLPSCSALLMFNQLRQVDVEGDDRDGDLPALENFGVDFANHPQGVAGYHNGSGAAFQERRMRHRLEGVFLSEMIEEHVETGMDLGEMSRRVSDHGAKDRVRS